MVTAAQAGCPHPWVCSTFVNKGLMFTRSLDPGEKGATVICYLYLTCAPNTTSVMLAQHHAWFEDICLRSTPYYAAKLEGQPEEETSYHSSMRTCKGRWYGYRKRQLRCYQVEWSMDRNDFMVVSQKPGKDRIKIIRTLASHGSVSKAKGGLPNTENLGRPF